MFLEPHRDLASLYQNLQLITHPISDHHVSSAQKQWANTGILAHSSGRLSTDHLTFGREEVLRTRKTKAHPGTEGRQGRRLGFLPRMQPALG